MASSKLRRYDLWDQTHNSASSTMRVAPVSNHGLSDLRLSTCSPRSVGHTQVDWSTEPQGSGWVVSYIILCFISIYWYFNGGIWRKNLSRGTIHTLPTKMLALAFFSVAVFLFSLIKRKKPASKLSKLFSIHTNT